ncbi:SusC/RagA family TonB-linked outer membrane protein [Fodinibius halophilus]|uniref:TonB-dependent receptor n=1 Tax=Fodinibius halophilus TaxID=1736908 RepID=A0A6M1T4V5_9BACT|nr:TonB-dependent receptor [Fodinibius halophilus]NGP89067.1 TonB-dependent receptor [Fodinibius halophilus]
MSCLFLSTGVNAQSQVTVEGTVITKDTQEPLAGVNITVKNENRGTVTDTNGQYSISVADTDTLIFSFISFEKKEVPVNGRTTIDVVMKTDQIMAEEIIVVGYGTQKKSDLTGSVGSVAMENVEKLSGSNSADMLQGQVSGVSVSSGSGDPGSSPNVTIRGLGTIGNNDPLYIIDGVPGDISKVDPNNIESIDVLKDAASAAIYGSRASNGVIIVKTKRGTKDSGSTISFDAYTGIQSLDNKIDLANRQQYNTISQQMYNNAGLQPLAYTTGSGNYADTDWQDAFFDPGIEQKYNLSISGGTEDLTYTIAGGFYDQEGIATNTGHNKYNLRVNADYTNGKLKVGESFSYVRSNTQNMTGGSYGGGYGTIYQVMDMLPHTPVYDESNEGGYAGPPHPDMPKSSNPMATQELTTNESQSDFIQANVYGEYDILKNLTYELRFGANIDNGYLNYFAPTYYTSSIYKREVSYLSQQRSRNTETSIYTLLRYTNSFKDHDIEAMAGYSQERSIYKSSNASIDDLPSNEIRALSAGSGSASVSGSIFESTMRSQFGRLTYSYDSRYLFTGNIRRDGSSRFAESNRYGIFPSASVGWRISEESFFNFDNITNFKLRASLGKLGNQEIGNYQFIPTISAGSNYINYVLGEEQNIYNGAIITNFAATDIKWETTTSRNIGVDLSLYDDKIQFTADYYNNVTSDMLVNIPIPATSGSSAGPLTNGGEMETEGVEFSARYSEGNGPFTYNVRANISTSRNTVTKLGFKDEAFTGGYIEYGTHPTTRTVVGGEIARFYLYETDGLFQNAQEVQAHSSSSGLLQPNAAPGDVRFKDTNGDGVLNEDDKVYMGSAAPDFEYGLTFNANYQNFDLSVFVQGTYGNKMYNGTKFLTHRTDRNTNYSTELLDAWTPQNTDTDVPRNISGDPNGNARPSDRFLEDASYLRIKNLQLGYTLPDKLLGNSGVSKFRVYVSFENLATLTSYSGFDPSLNNFSLFRRGVDSGLYPLARTSMIGIQTQF